MEVIETLVFIACLLFFQLGLFQSIQLAKKNNIVHDECIFGVSLDVVDDAISEFTIGLNFEDQWNVVPLPSRLNIERSFKKTRTLESYVILNINNTEREKQLIGWLQLKILTTMPVI